MYCIEATTFRGIRTFKYCKSLGSSMAQKKQKGPSIEKAVWYGIATIFVAAVLFYFFRAIG
jgi:hypothetical protein